MLTQLQTSNVLRAFSQTGLFSKRVSGQTFLLAHVFDSTANACGLDNVRWANLDMPRQQPLKADTPEASDFRQCRDTRCHFFVLNSRDVLCRSFLRENHTGEDFFAEARVLSNLLNADAEALRNILFHVLYIFVCGLNVCSNQDLFFCKGQNQSIYVCMTEIKTKQIGLVQAHPKGFGFALTEGGEVFISPALMKELLPGDKIVFDAEPGKAKGSLQVARPLIVERPESVWVGSLRVDNGSCYLDTDEPCFVSIEIKDISYCAPEQVVSVRVGGFTSAGTRGQPRVLARLERILGDERSNDFFLHYALAKHDFIESFPPHSVPKQPSVTLGPSRTDLRDVPFITIDGPESRDLDDAVWGRTSDEGFEVYVAISDVSAYIPEGSPLDKIAYRRGTSVYLPGKTVPMLPEALSNGLCSLLEGVERLAVVVKMSLDKAGELKAFDFGRAVIVSRKRLTYDEVLKWKKGELALDEEVEGSLSTLWSLYETLAQKRRDRGQLEFMDKEPHLTVEDGKPRLVWTTRHDAHKLVEELMLLTNHAVAAHLQKTDKVGLFRHQPRPDGEKWQAFHEWSTRQEEFELPQEPCMKSISAFMKAITGPQQIKAEIRLKGAMQAAYYEALESSHFSLGYPHYTHFTSPIRRYADLMVHRLLLGESGLSQDELSKRAVHCSLKAKNARFAERGVWDRIKKNALMAHGGEMPAQVISQSGHGVRVLNPEAQCMLFVPAQCLKEKGFKFNHESKNWGTSENSLDVGSQLVIKFTSAQTDRKRIELFASLISVALF